MSQTTIESQPQNTASSLDLFSVYQKTIDPLPGPFVRSVTRLTVDPGVTRLNLARSHTFQEIDHEIFSTSIILLPLIHEGLFSVTRESMCTKFWLSA